MKHFFLILLMTIGGIATTKSQQPVMSAAPAASLASDDQEQHLQNLVRSFYANLDRVVAEKNGNIEPVTKMLDKNFSAVRYIIDVDGRQTRSEMTVDGYRNQIAQLSMIPGFKTNYEVQAVNFTKSFETFGLVNYTLQITGTLNEETVLRFRSIVTTYFRHDTNGEWVIFESNGVNVYQDQEVGICPVAFTKVSKDESQYTASVLSPAGNTFKSDKLDFNFKVAGAKTLVTCGKNTYVIEGSQVSCVQDNGSPSALKLGKAATRIECINLVLSQHLYAGKCLGFKTMER
jgi:hypothetical protein